MFCYFCVCCWALFELFSWLLFGVVMCFGFLIVLLVLRYVVVLFIVYLWCL